MASGDPSLGIAVVGNVVPFRAGLAFLGLYDTSRFLGPAGDRFSFGLVFALAIAVTSIPVISRIMADLGILGSRFARIVLSVAVLEDLVNYVVLNIALARVAAVDGQALLDHPLCVEVPHSVGLGREAGEVSVTGGGRASRRHRLVKANLIPPPPPAAGSAERPWEDAPRAPVSNDPRRAPVTGHVPDPKGGQMFVGIDWAKDAHEVCAVDTSGKVRHRATIPTPRTAWTSWSVT